MCGGSGTRLWPASRAARPKQFLRLLGDHSLFQQAVLRVSDNELFETPICMTNEEYRFIVAEQLHDIGADAEILLEPCRRDSAPALSAGCHVALSGDADAVILAMPADHLIGDQEAFIEAVRVAHDAASEGYIATFGIQPDRAETSYGYIKPSKTRVGDGPALRVAKFTEKPDAVRAEKYQRKNYLWNAGMFLVGARTLLDEIDRHTPEIVRHTKQAVDAAARDLDFLRLEPSAFAMAPTISIDYAVIEKTDRAAVVPISYPWSDMGGWNALWEATSKDEQGNAVQGNGYVFDGRNNYVRSNEFLTAVIGVDNMVVVSTGDAVMVVPRDRLDEIKPVVERLRAAQHPEIDSHREHYRPWGHFLMVDQGERYQVKRIVVKPNGRLSLQKHYHRAEHWVVVRGTARVTVDGKQRVLTENESIYVPLGTTHRLENPGRVPLELIEVQTGSYLGEDDIIRYEDVYNRITEHQRAGLAALEDAVGNLDQIESAGPESSDE